jgi:hypothetical protein
LITNTGGYLGIPIPLYPPAYWDGESVFFMAQMARETMLERFHSSSHVTGLQRLPNGGFLKWGYPQIIHV